MAAERIRSSFGLLGKFDADDGAAAKVHVQRQAMPEEDGEQAGNAEDEREAEEIPLLPEPVDFCVMKQFHEIRLFRWRSVRHAACG